MRGLFNFFRADPRLALYGITIAYGSSFGQTFFISQFGGEIRGEFDLTDGEFGLIYMLGTLMSAAVIVYTGGLVDRVDLRRWTVCLLVGCVAACLVMGSVQGPITLFLAIFLLRQTGQGLMSHTTGHSLGRYATVGRGKALAFGAYGYPIGEATFPLLAVAGIAWLGWRDTWFALAMVYLALFLPVLRGLLMGHDTRYTRWREEQDRADAASDADRAAGRAPMRSWRRRDVLRDPRFWILMPGIMAPSFIVTGILLHGVRLAEMKGWSHELWAASLIAYAIGSVPASLAVGAFVDRYGAPKSLILFLPPLVAGCIALALGQGVWAAIAFMALSGASAGATHIIGIALWAEVYGTRYLGEIKAVLTALGVFASALAPLILGWMIDAGWSVADIALAMAAYAGAGIGLCAIAMARYRVGSGYSQYG